MKESKDIHACPFCGSNAEIVKAMTGWRAHCTEQMCQASLNEFSTEPAARRAWNRRAGGMTRGATEGSRLGASGGSVSVVELGEALDQAVKLMDTPEFKREQSWHMGRDVVLHVWDKWCNSKRRQSVSLSDKGAAHNE